MIKVYVSNTSGNMLMKVHQDHIRRILEAKKINFEEIDIADPKKKDDKVFMQQTLRLDDSDLVALPPQIFKDASHRGDYETFFTAVERERLFNYLDLTVPTDEVEYKRQEG